MSLPFLDLGALHADLRADLDAAWREVTEAETYIGGPFVERFEEAWAAYCGTRRCVGVSSGTAAIELTLRALGVGEGDEVLVPANSFVATAEAVVSAGATPVFVDVEADTLLMSAATVRDALTPRSAAIIAVHLFGEPVDMTGMAILAAQAGVALIEDAAQAHGATWRGRRAGGLSQAGCFSFYPGKNLGAFGDAGAVVTDDDALAARIRMIANHGRPPGNAHLHDCLGGSDRLDAVQAAVLLAKLPWLDRWNDARRQVADRYRLALAELPLTMPARLSGGRGANHLMVVQCDRRDEVRAALAAAGIGTGIHYPVPCHLQGAFQAPGRRPLALPVVEAAARRMLSLPLHPHVSAAQIGIVADALASALLARPALAG
ncbi:MAG TPA: DegT/DnrJ/EryC1/StrS family aminotransferase [Azospirillaceae bacterium]|nr:DegT/DnrJ/EryC1/StrS family aminotransferase [Azospirillaceae bacterium]